MVEKNNTSTWVIIIISIFIILLIFFVYYGATHNWFKGEKEEIIQVNKTVYLSIIDEVTKKPIDGNYSLEYMDGPRIVVSQGTIDKDTPVEVLLTKDGIFYEFYCWANDHYTKKFLISSAAIESGRKLECSTYKFGDVNLSYIGSIEDGMVKLNVSSPNTLLGIGICLSWTPGIIRASYEEGVSTCNGDIWRNYTKYNPPNATSDNPYYEWLPKNQYVCNYNREGLEESYDTCDEVIGTKCYLSKPSTPTRYKLIADSCFNTGKSLQAPGKSTEQFNIVITKTQDLNCFDSLKIYVYDATRIKIGDNWLKVHSDTENKDVALPDQFIELKKKGCN